MHLDPDPNTPFVGFQKLDDLKKLIQSFPIDDQSRSSAYCLIESAASSFSSLLSDYCVKLTSETIEERERDKIVVLDNVPEQAHISPSDRNNADLALARAFSDKLELTGTIYATERIGKIDATAHANSNCSFYLVQMHSLFSSVFMFMHAPIQLSQGFSQGNPCLKPKENEILN